MIRIVAFTILSMAMLGASESRAERLVTSLSSHRVMISSSFTGTELALFGSVERDAATVARRGEYNIVVTVSGPRETLVTRQKDRVLGIWTNTASRTFLNAPTYLAVLSNKPLNAIVAPEMRKQLDIGMNLIPLPEHLSAPGASDEAFRDALIRLRKSRGLYVEDQANITFLTPNLFRATILLPAEAPVGNYEVDVKLFADGAQIARATSALEVVKVGIERFIVASAQNHSFLYGLFTTLMALVTGWFASVVFRRD